MAVGVLPLVLEIVQSMIRGHFGVDLVALVAIGTSLALGEYLAGSVILLMLSGGEALEGYALRRARKDLTDLISNAPTTAHKKDGEQLKDIPAESVVIGDIIVVKPGEIIPVDGEVIDGKAMVDESTLTGESMPVDKSTGHSVMSGSVSKDGVLTIRALKPSAESKFAQIIRLVQDAEQRKAPFVRLADRYSVWFTALTFVLAILAWSLAHDPIRLLAVLVVATPCPLILATPIAFASGIATAAKRGIIVKNGGVLEKLGEARCFVFDKTGTLTLGTPTIERTQSFTSIPEKELLRLATSLDQLSAHVLASSLVIDAKSRGSKLSLPKHFSEKLGDGVTGELDGKRYTFGRLAYLKTLKLSIPSEATQMHEQMQTSGGIAVFLADDTQVIGAIVFADSIRPNVRELFSKLTTLGIQKVVMLTGDKKRVADHIGKELGLEPENIRAEALPEDKVKVVEQLKTTNPPVVMVGDGINDAPAITAADVGIAMGGHGSTASSEAGDIVLLVDRIERVGDALLIGNRVLYIAKQSILIGIGLSAGLMVIAAFGYIQPVMGALLQEAIDVAVILNALRVLWVEQELSQTEAQA